MKDKGITEVLPDWLIRKQPRQVGIEYARGTVTVVSVQSEEVRFQSGQPLQAFSGKKRFKHQHV